MEGWMDGWVGAWMEWRIGKRTLHQNQEDKSTLLLCDFWEASLSLTYLICRIGIFSYLHEDTGLDHIEAKFPSRSIIFWFKYAPRVITKENLFPFLSLPAAATVSTRRPLKEESCSRHESAVGCLYVQASASYSLHPDGGRRWKHC